jgi:nucleotide-binding universal stress UspA family protein
VYKKILVPLDGSELAECSLNHARAIAQGCNTPEVVLLRVVEPLPAISTAAYVDAGSDFLSKVTEIGRVEAENYLANLSRRLKSEGWNVTTSLAHGAAAAKILEYAEKNQVDLIVMSTHGRSGMSRFMFGSVADKVVRHALIPVLTVAPSVCAVTGKQP